jgi:glucokinase
VSLYLGIDLGGTRVRAAVGDEHGALLRRAEERTGRDYTRAREGQWPSGSEGQAIADQVCRLAERVAGDDKSRIKAVGAGAPGPLDAATGVLYHPVNLTSDDIPLKAALEQRLGMSAYVHNDANVAALGEWVHGRHGQTQHLLYITVSTGLGAGIISHGRLIDGFNSTAGELGHTVIDPSGPGCGCGNRGCVEAISSGTSIARDARAAVQAGKPSVMLELAGGNQERITAEVVVEAARQGDALASAIFFHAADTLGAAVVNAIHMLSPEVVVIGGGVAQAGELLFGPVRERVRTKAMPLTARGVRIEPAGLGQDAGLVGALVLAMRQSNETGGGRVEEATHGT